MRKIEESFLNLWDNNKGSNYHRTGNWNSRSGEERKWGKKTFKEIIFENFPNLVKEVKI